MAPGDRVTLHTGDCLDVMPTLAAGSVDAVVTDPPYNLTSIGQRFGKAGSAPVKDEKFGGRYGRLARGFMGKAWDGDGVAFDPATWEAVGRVARPGAYLLAFGGTRTVHRMTCAIEDAGWVIRDVLCWVYASGFPKSRASLKPAWEPIVMARKPGASSPLQIDAARIGTEPRGTGNKVNAGRGDGISRLGGGDGASYDADKPAARWPANVVLTDPIFDGDVPGVVGGGDTTSGSRNGEYSSGDFFSGLGPVTAPLAGDSGTYSRFFLIPKADRAEREPIWASLPERHGPTLGISNSDDWTNGSGNPGKPPQPRQNVHPTVKPLDLMRHLVRLVTPPGGNVLDPFLGSGTTALACEMEGFPWIGIEREPEYVAIAEARLLGTQRGMGLVTP